MNDPLFETMLPHYKNKNNLYLHPQGYKTPDLNHIKNEPSHIYEMYEGYIIVDFVPTSENISAWLLKVVQKKMMEINISVSYLEFLETPKSKSTVYCN